MLAGLPSPAYVGQVRIEQELKMMDKRISPIATSDSFAFMIDRKVF
jgi:hypothetical protein